MVNYSLLFVFYRRSENVIKKVINFVLSELNIPALTQPEISLEIKYKVRNTEARIRFFKKLGNLKIIMNKF